MCKYVIAYKFGGLSRIHRMFHDLDAAAKEFDRFCRERPQESVVLLEVDVSSGQKVVLDARGPYSAKDTVISSITHWTGAPPR